jgi:hypothetical protein
MKRHVFALLFTWTALFCCANTFAYPPENAAVLYYKHMNHFITPEEAVWDELCDLPANRKAPSDAARGFIAKQKDTYLIQELDIASGLKYCDWGLDLTQGFSMLMSGLGQMRNFNHLILADGAVALSEGDVSTALDKNLSARRMAHHVSNDTLISFLVAYSMTHKSNQALQSILASGKLSSMEIRDLKRQLLLEPYQPLSLVRPLMNEKDVCLLEVQRMTPQRYIQLTRDWKTSVEEESEKRIRRLLEDAGPEFRSRSADYFEQIFNRFLSSLEKPYPEAFAGIQKAGEKPKEDFQDGQDEAMLASVFCPALAKSYNHSIRWKTEYDALLTALEIYRIAAETGELPETLPNSSYVDFFSREPFLYEITEDRFVLRCRQEDLIDGKVQEYTFKIAK